ncbi:MAG: diaminopimelate decarboxylase [Candidatus Omnitrophica bacterium]|nr:diaminopimelate decarboxylase [Candidatus Omnitrophota bacterium]MBD3268571.1 diaminopimelate decarboxylase [Candidatus Omnitrophota bacterium]
MHYFAFKRNTLYCENTRIKKLAEGFGTPLYVYSERTIREHYNKIKKAFKEVKPLICYSVKANSNLSILKIIKSLGGGLDIVSGGELYRAKAVKCRPEKIVYASVGKSEAEIKDALKYGILMFNVESAAELERINSACIKMKKKAKVSLRFNPDVEPGTHTYITTGKKETKFGLDEGSLKKIFLESKRYKSIVLCGIHIHIGSQITTSHPFLKALKKVSGIVKYLRTKNIAIDYLNIGGGLGIVYGEEKPQTAADFAKKVLPLIKPLSLKLIIEPGRFIVGNAGVLVAKVLYIKDTKSKRFIIVDAAMNDLIRPSLYDAYHTIVGVDKVKGPPGRSSDIVGPVCESGDFLGKDRPLKVKEGDYIAVLGAGAYGFSMSSNYNSRPRPAEVLVKNNKTTLVRKRENYKDLIEKEV